MWEGSLWGLIMTLLCVDHIHPLYHCSCPPLYPSFFNLAIFKNGFHKDIFIHLYNVLHRCFRNIMSFYFQENFKGFSWLLGKFTWFQKEILSNSETYIFLSIVPSKPKVYCSQPELVALTYIFSRRIQV
jgi:hypothetical protein